MKPSKLAPATPPPALLPGPKSVCSCLLLCRRSSVFSRQGNSCQFFQSLQGEDRCTSHFSEENSLCLISPSPSRLQLCNEEDSAPGKILGAEGGVCNRTPRPTLPLRVPPLPLSSSFSFPGFSLPFPPPSFQSSRSSYHSSLLPGSRSQSWGRHRLFPSLSGLAGKGFVLACSWMSGTNPCMRA